MFKKLNSSSETQTAIAFISASAGELDWLLPILDDLLKKGFNVKIIFLTRQARLSVTKNRMLDDYISQQNIQELKNLRVNDTAPRRPAYCATSTSSSQ